MKMNKKGQGGLSMDTIIIAVIAIVVLLVLVLFFTGSMTNVSKRITSVFKAGTSETELSFAQKTCEDYCTSALEKATAGQVQSKEAAWCFYTFAIDLDRNNKVDDNEKEVKCKDIPGISCSVQCVG